MVNRRRKGKKVKKGSEVVTKVTSVSVGEEDDLVSVPPIDTIPPIVFEPALSLTNSVLKRVKKGLKATKVTGLSEEEGNDLGDSSAVDPALLERVLTNSVVMTEVFRNLWDVDCLKNCRLVCRNWNDIGRPLLLNTTMFDLLYKYKEEKYHRKGAAKRKRRIKLDLEEVLPYQSILIGTPQPSISDETERCTAFSVTVEVEPSELVECINHCKKDVKYLHLAAQTYHSSHPAAANFEKYPTLVLPKLRTLVINDLVSVWDEESVKPQTEFVVDLIKRCPNLVELIITEECLDSLGVDEDDDHFFYTLFPSLKSNLHFTSNLQVLQLSCSYIEKKKVEMLRGMKMRLKTLSITFYVFDNEPNPEMVGWIEELSPTLVTLELKTSRELPAWEFNVPPPPLFILSFPSEMSVLKRLEIDEAGMFGVKEIPEFLSKLPVLQTLHLTAAIPLEEAQISGQTKPLQLFPQMKDFFVTTETECDPLDQETPLEPSDFSSSMLASRSFPNLRRLAIPVYTWKDLLRMIEELKNSKIEDLRVHLFENTLKGRKSALAKRTSLSKWIGLSKLTVEYAGGLFPGATGPVQQNLLSILSEGKSLTCLELHGFGKIPFTWIKELVQELPLLRSLVVGGPKYHFVYCNGVKLSEDEVQAKLHTSLGLSCNPYLCVVKKNDERFCK